MSLLALMETTDETNGQTALFALQFKDGANKALSLTGDGKGKPVDASRFLMSTINVSSVLL